ncbi:hypothetical protein LJQ69_005062, partial [Serratia marcescens]
MERCDEQQQNIGKELHEDPGRLLKMSSIINSASHLPTGGDKKTRRGGFMQESFSEVSLIRRP